jgi:hypothetical protein
MQVKKRICFVIVWYGKLPPYFLLFLQSVKNQPFDILFITDHPAPELLPENFIWKQMGWQEMKDDMGKKLGMTDPNFAPYKLCDFKPCFGYVYADWLTSYDFWGWIDTDIMMGKFENFITNDMLDHYDIISVIKEYASGCFCIIRNQAACNELFMKSRSWKDVRSNPKMVGFDECSKEWKALKAGKDIFSLHTPIQSFTEVIFLEVKKGLRCLFSDMIIEPVGFEPVRMVNGSVFYHSKEYLLVHLIYFKTRGWFLYNIFNYQTPYYMNAFGISKSLPNKVNFIIKRNFWRTIFFRIKIQFPKVK